MFCTNGVRWEHPNHPKFYFCFVQMYPAVLPPWWNWQPTIPWLIAYCSQVMNPHMETWSRVVHASYFLVDFLFFPSQSVWLFFPSLLETSAIPYGAEAVPVCFQTNLIWFGSRQHYLKSHSRYQTRARSLVGAWNILIGGKGILSFGKAIRRTAVCW